MPWSRILVDGAMLSALAVLLIFASLRANPRIWLNDFPPDIRQAVPPKTEAEKRQSLIWGLPFLAVLLGGPALYLLGNALFKMTVNRSHFPLSHLVGLGLLAALVAPALRLSVFWTAALTTAVLLTVAVWETLSLRGVRAHLAEHAGH